MRIIALIVIVAAGLSMSGCSGGKKENSHPSGQLVIVKGVPLEQVQSRDIQDNREAVGTVKAETSAVVAARIAGTVTVMNVKEGDRVKKGQLLAIVEAAEASAGAAAANAGVEEARQGVEEAGARKKLADATFQRYRKLFAEQAITRQEYENRQTESEVAAQGFARAESRLVQAREHARAAGIMADYSRILSPLNGVVTARSADRGATVFPGMPILTLEAETGYRLEVQVSESMKERVNAGQPVDVALDGEQIQKGQIVEVVPTVDPASRTFTVKIALGTMRVRSGGYGKAYFPAGTAKGILIPRQALIERGTLTSVWVVDSGNIARMRLVKQGKVIGDRVEVLAGLSEGERIVASGIDKITDGAKVE